MSDTDRENYAPAIFFEYDDNPGTFCLMLTDNAFYTLSDVFEAVGHEGNGYSWTHLAKHLVASKGLDDTDVGFDPEAGMMVAYGKNEATLRALGTELAALLGDRDALAAEVVHIAR